MNVVNQIKIQAIDAGGDTESTTKHGLEFLELIKEAKDKRYEPSHSINLIQQAAESRATRFRSL